MKKSDRMTEAILIIDDKPGNIFSLENLLEKKDRIFLTATNGAEGLKIALNKAVDLIILDVQMPDMDGFEVAQILKSNKKTKDIPIIFASAEKKEHASILKGFDEGAIDYLFKPLDPHVTKAKVEVLLKIQLQKKELLEKNISLEKSALLINNSSDIIGIIDPISLKFEEVNNAFTTILGYSLDEVKETSITFFLPADDRQLIQDKIKQDKEKLSFETRVYSKDRTIKWLHWHVTVRDKKWFVNARDITEVKEVERIRNYVAAIVKQSSDAIYIHDQEGRIISWNEGAERIYGYTEREALNMKIWNIIPEYIQPETQEMVHKIMEGTKIKDQETKRITKRGQIVDVLFSASIIIDSSDQQKSIAITERDVTQQKIADEKILELNSDLQKNVEELEITNKELESFSYSVSHDLRAPLRAIHGNAAIIKEDVALEGEPALAIEKIQRNATRMDQLIDDLLAFSKIGKAEIRKSQTDMEDLVRKSITELCESTQHKAAIKINPLPPAVADRALLEQVWVNLISNAIKYSGKKESPEIEIGSKNLDDLIIYYIKDNGAGFDMHYANKLFDTFQRLHRASEFEGTGIGLAIVKRIITRHKGRIWAEAKPDKGATFYFTLPSTGI
jgi:PAS domain S-box-containing protein